MFLKVINENIEKENESFLNEIKLERLKKVLKLDIENDKLRNILNEILFEKE